LARQVHISIAKTQGNLMQAKLFIQTRHALVAGCMAIFSLSACEDLPMPTAPSAAATAGGAAPAPDPDVTRADLFNITESAIWDGRPTFGGVWIAYAGEVQPERVRITNRANGKTVIGALFRRERETPGPSIQVSADAASALGMVAGTPVELNVTALRRESTNTPAPAPAPAATPDVAAETPAPAAAAPVVAAPAEEQRPVARAQAAAPATPDAAIDESPLAIPSDTAATPPAAAPSPAPEPAPSGAPSRPYVQVGTFSSQPVANALVTTLASSDVTAGVRQVEVNGRTLYRVIAGPADSDAALAALIAKLKELGYSDAFPIK